MSDLSERLTASANALADKRSELADSTDPDLVRAARSLAQAERILRQLARDTATKE